MRNVAHNAGLVLVVGSTNSSNSNRLVEVSRNLGTIGYLIDNSQAIDPEWLKGVSTVAVTAGASAPEDPGRRRRQLFASKRLLERRRS